MMGGYLLIIYIGLTIITAIIIILLKKYRANSTNISDNIIKDAEDKQLEQIRYYLNQHQGGGFRFYLLHCEQCARRILS